VNECRRSALSLLRWFKVGTSSLLFFCAIAVLPCSIALANPASSEVRLDTDAMSIIYQERVALEIWNVCVQRFPKARPGWDVALARWQGRNKQALDELRRMKTTIDLALRSSVTTASGQENWTLILTAQDRADFLVLKLMAPLDDASALVYCGDAKSRYSDEILDSANLADARSATDAALNWLSISH